MLLPEIEKLIKVFAAEVGYTCKDKLNKYAKDIDENHPDWYNGRKYFKGADWCTIYFDWCFITAFGEERAREILNRPKKSLGAGVRYSREYLKAKGRVDQKVYPGSAIYFGTLPYPHHIGFVYKVENKRIYTYEGNVSYSSGVTGVKAKDYSISYSDILDFGHPLYKEEEEEMKFSDLKELSYVKGKVITGDAVRVAQSIVIPEEIDGSFGPRTKKAVESFQKQNGCTVDGVVGPETWEEIWDRCRK